VDFQVQIKTLSFSKTKIGELANLEPHAADSPPQTTDTSSANQPITKSEDSDSRPTNQPIICAVCGSELIDARGKIVKGHTNKNGQFYCAQPGCGYPARKEGRVRSMSPCPLCASTRIRISGYRGLNLFYRCAACETTFLEEMPLEDDLIRSENKAAEAAKI